MQAGSEAVTIRHVFDAPRALVWATWTDPEHLARWWGPHSFTAPGCELEVRPGGAIRIEMKGPDEAIHSMTGTYLEVVEPHRLVFSAALLDTAGESLLEVLYTAVFEEALGKTELVLTTEVLSAVPLATRYLEGMASGWRESLEKLDRVLSTMQHTSYPSTNIDQEQAHGR